MQRMPPVEVISETRMITFAQPQMPLTILPTYPSGVMLKLLGKVKLTVLPAPAAGLLFTAAVVVNFYCFVPSWLRIMPSLFCTAIFPATDNICVGFKMPMPALPVCKTVMALLLVFKAVHYQFEICG
jgi:hypothetical protein